jgi:DNA-binding Lrp family transcriptional regulator
VDEQFAAVRVATLPGMSDPHPALDEVVDELDAKGGTESTVRRRIAELVGGGVLMFEVEVDPRLYGRHLDVICWLDVHPAALGDVASALA